MFNNLRGTNDRILFHRSNAFKQLRLKLTKAGYLSKCKSRESLYANAHLFNVHSNDYTVAKKRLPTPGSALSIINKGFRSLKPSIRSPKWTRANPFNVGKPVHFFATSCTKRTFARGRKQKTTAVHYFFSKTKVRFLQKILNHSSRRGAHPFLFDFFLRKRLHSLKKLRKTTIKGLLREYKSLQ